MGVLEKCGLWGTKPEVLKGRAKRPGAGRRKEDRGEALGAELPRARRPERANGGGRDSLLQPGGGGGYCQAPEKLLLSPAHL